MYSREAKEQKLPALSNQPAQNGDYPLRPDLSAKPHRIHSQYEALSWLSKEYDGILRMNYKDAAARDLSEETGSGFITLKEPSAENSG